MIDYKNPDIPGWMSEAELDWLFQTACQMTSVVEIGCWKGRSTRALLCGCKGTVFAVDHFLGNPSERDSPGPHEEAKRIDISKVFMENVGHFPNLVLLKKDSLEAARTFQPGAVDFVFIDGEHTFDAVRADLEAWLPIAKNLIAGHDFSVAGVLRAVKEKFGDNIQRPVGEIWAHRIG